MPALEIVDSLQPRFVWEPQIEEHEIKAVYLQHTQTLTRIACVVYLDGWIEGLDQECGTFAEDAVIIDQ